MTAPIPPLPVAALAGIWLAGQRGGGERTEHGMSDLWCKHCGPSHPLRIEWREILEAKPIGTFSLAGAGMKVSCVKHEWPWAVCDNCGRESRGKLAADTEGADHA